MQGVLPGVALDNLSGFPTLKNIPHSAELRRDVDINVFGHPPRNPESVIITIDEAYVQQFMNAEVQSDGEDVWFANLPIPLRVWCGKYLSFPPFLFSACT